MSSINGLGSSSPLSPLNPSSRLSTASAAPASSPTRGGDSVELSSDVSKYLSILKSKSGDVRTDKVASIRAQIEAGTYDTDEKLDGSLDGLLDDIG